MVKKIKKLTKVIKALTDIRDRNSNIRNKNNNREPLIISKVVDRPPYKNKYNIRPHKKQ